MEQNAESSPNSEPGTAEGVVQSAWTGISQNETIPAAMTASTGWKRTLWVMATVQGIMMLAFTSMGPFLALYIEQLGVHRTQSIDIWSGVISSSNFLVMAIVSPLWGSLADRKGRKLMVMRTTLDISVFTLSSAP